MGVLSAWDVATDVSRLCCPLVISESVRVCSFTLSGVALSDRARLCIVRSLLIVLSELVLVFRGVRRSGPVIVLQSSNSVITSASAPGLFIARKSRLPPYSTSSCCAERAAVGSPTTSSTSRTTQDEPGIVCCLVPSKGCPIALRCYLRRVASFPRSAD